MMIKEIAPSVLSTNLSNWLAVTQSFAFRLINGPLVINLHVTQTGEQPAQINAQLGQLSTFKISSSVYKNTSKELPTCLTQFVHSFKTLKTAQNSGLQKATHSFTPLYYYY